MAIGSRQQLIEYCLRRLGAPVIKINIADEQLSDRVDDALQKFGEYHFNGTHRTYFKYQIKEQDKIKQYITLPENIIGAVEIFPLQGFVVNGSDMFDIRYQIALNDLYTLSGTDMVPYTMTMSHLSLMNELLVGRIPVRYNRRNGNKLFIDTNWAELQVGSWIVVHAHELVDPDDFDGVYDEMWLKDYVTAMIKRQWGVNLSKFTGVPLPGGMVLNGLEIMRQADQELEKCERDLDTKYTMPPLDRWA